jgi:uncharacterized membrane protein
VGEKVREEEIMSFYLYICILSPHLVLIMKRVFLHFQLRFDPSFQFFITHHWMTCILNGYVCACVLVSYLRFFFTVNLTLVCVHE